MHDYLNREKFGLFIDTCIGNRVEQLSNEFIYTRKYQNFNRDIDELLEVIARSAPRELPKLLETYFEKHSLHIVDHQEHFYKQGFADCMMIMRHLGM